MRIDITTIVDGVTFIQNKRATGRPQDLVDLQRLEDENPSD